MDCVSQIHGSVSGRDFKTKLRAKRIELLQSPWLIELGAFYLNFSDSDSGEPAEFFRKFSCDLNDTQPAMTMSISDSVKYEYSLTCAICLVRCYLLFHFLLSVKFMHIMTVQNGISRSPTSHVIRKLCGLSIHLPSLISIFFRYLWRGSLK